MPPAISDDESSVVGELAVPIRRGRKSTSAGAESDAKIDDEVINGDVDDEEEGGEGDEDDEDLGDDEFIVETIKKHTIDEDGSLKFQVKWEGYESKKDLTWEPEDNLKESAAQILAEYFKSLGGRDKIFEETEKAVKGKKRGRAPGGTPSTVSKRSRRSGAHPSESTPPVSAKKWTPPAGSWEDDIDLIDACEDEGSGKLVVYLVWKNGYKTKHDTSIVYKKCPQKASLKSWRESQPTAYKFADTRQMLQFYERHVRIIRDENKEFADGAEA